MKKQYTYIQLLTMMASKGNNIADLLICKMMDDIKQMTGVYPNWNDITPGWVVDKCKSIEVETI